MAVPTLQDLEARLSEIARDAEQALGKKTAALTADAAGSGALSGSRINLVYADALDEAWRQVVLMMLQTSRRYQRRGAQEESAVRALAEHRLTELFPLLVKTSRVLAGGLRLQDSGPARDQAKVEEIRSFLDARLREFDLGLDEGARAGAARLSDGLATRRSSTTINANNHIGEALTGAPPEVEPAPEAHARDPSAGPVTIGDGWPSTIDAEAATHGGAPPGGSDRSVSVQPHDGVSQSEASSPELTAPPSHRASGWTGRRPLREQVEVIRLYGPLAAQGVDELVKAIEEKRFNDVDDATSDAVKALRELHTAIGALLAAAEGGGPLAPIWQVYEARKLDLTAAIERGAKVMIAAPIVAIGAAHVLSWLSGYAMTDEMVTALCTASVFGGEVRQRRD